MPITLALYTAICWFTATTSLTLDLAWQQGDLADPPLDASGEGAT